MNLRDKKALNHLEWIYPKQEVVYMSTGNFGIKYKGMIFKSDLEKINSIGFDVENIQQWEGDKPLQYGVIVTIKDRIEERGGIQN